MREIVTEADAPRGSLQHYFPGGKEELVSDALRPGALWLPPQRIRQHEPAYPPAAAPERRFGRGDPASGA
jgi:AcrR family transcriptional regulator